MVEYHPSSGRRPRTFKFEEFTRTAPACTPSADPEPWAPFKTRADFEFAALAQDTRMSKAQVNSLIALFHRCIESGKDSFTLSNYGEMRNTLTVASEQLPKVFTNFPSNVLYFLILCYLSLKRKLFPMSTKISFMNLMSGYAQYGHGLRTCCRTQISFNTLNGMLITCQSLMDSQPLGFDSMMNHGQQTDSGKFRYVRLILYYPICY